MAEQSRVQPSRFEYDLDDGFDDLNEGFADLKMSDTFLDIGFGDESSGSQLQTVSSAPKATLALATAPPPAMAYPQSSSTRNSYQPDVVRNSYQPEARSSYQGDLRPSPSAAVSPGSLPQSQAYSQAQPPIAQSRTTIISNSTPQPRSASMVRQPVATNPLPVNVAPVATTAPTMKRPSLSTIIVSQSPIKPASARLVQLPPSLPEAPPLPAPAPTALHPPPVALPQTVPPPASYAVREDDSRRTGPAPTTPNPDPIPLPLDLGDSSTARQSFDSLDDILATVEKKKVVLPEGYYTVSLGTLPPREFGKNYSSATPSQQPPLPQPPLPAHHPSPIKPAHANTVASAPLRAVSPNPMPNPPAQTINTASYSQSPSTSAPRVKSASKSMQDQELLMADTVSVLDYFTNFEEDTPQKRATGPSELDPTPPPAASWRSSRIIVSSTPPAKRLSAVAASPSNPNRKSASGLTIASSRLSWRASQDDADRINAVAVAPPLAEMAVPAPIPMSQAAHVDHDSSSGNFDQDSGWEEIDPMMNTRALQHAAPPLYEFSSLDLEMTDEFHFGDES